MDNGKCDLHDDHYKLKIKLEHYPINFTKYYGNGRMIHFNDENIYRLEAGTVIDQKRYNYSSLFSGATIRLDYKGGNEDKKYMYINVFSLTLQKTLSAVNKTY